MTDSTNEQGISTSGLCAHNYDTAFVTQRIVAAPDIDILGHVNNAVYVRWVQNAAVGHWDHVTSGAMAADHVWVCLRHEIDYRVPLLIDDNVEIRTWLGKRSGPKFNRFVDIRKKGAARWSAQAKTTWVMIAKATRKPQRVGDDVIRAFGFDPGTYDKNNAPY